MPKCRPMTRRKSDENYGGGPCELTMTEPSTYKQVIQYYYFLIISNPNSDFYGVVQKIVKDITAIWLNVNPKLPIINNKSICNKVKHLLTVVKDINRKHVKARVKNNLDEKLDKLFDISACTCSLDILPCSDRRVHCTIEKCAEEHIVCVCSSDAKVPIEDRAYLRDQRSKSGPKGAYQLSSIDQTAAKRNRKTTHEEHEVITQENVDLSTDFEVPMQLPESSSNSSNDEVYFVIEVHTIL